jgi:zinc protease
MSRTRPPRSRRLLALGALVSGLSLTQPVDAGPRRAAEARTLDLDMPVEEFTLDNGLRVLVVEDHSTPAFSITLTYQVGSVDEEKGRTGFAHFFEHMMFMGSKNLARFAIGQNTESAGGAMNAGTTYDFTIYFHSIPSNYLDMILWGESDRLRSLEITEESFETQRAAVKSEKNLRVDNVPYVSAIQDDMFGTVFAGTPYSHMVIGSLDDLNAAEVSDVQAFFDRYYMPNNCTMVIVGDVDPANVQAKVKQYFADIPKGELPKRPDYGDQTNRGKKIEKQVPDEKAQQVIYAFGWPTVGAQHEDAAALDLLGNILMGGQSARLPKILNDDEKLTVGAFGGHGVGQPLVGAGFMLFTAVPKDKTNPADVKEIVKKEIATIAKKGISKAELAKAINGQLMQSLQTIETNQGRAFAAGVGAAFFDDPKFAITQLDRYRKVTNADIKRVAAKYVTENWVFYEVGPQDKLSEPEKPEVESPR